MIINVKKYNEGELVLPEKAHHLDACFDVVATSMTDLGDGRIEYGLGFGLQPEHLGTGIQFDFRARSSIHKTGLILANCIATGDENFTGQYKAVFYNIIPSLPNYKIGDRILQLQVTKSIDVEFQETIKFEETSRGSGAFGSTGE